MLVRVKTKAELDEITEPTRNSPSIFIRKGSTIVLGYITSDDYKYCGKFFPGVEDKFVYSIWVDLDICVLPTWAVDIIPETNFDKI